ncbi:hypothetical protein A0H81_12729 [Grifola frondosa]|uniref:Peptidase S59 domain-containing protein n=1 Tax=Grifola frondosa TaxID=5627 RepID=A0A1C7LS57_GRIFR|nr:hypothetical protein A0H81_12729 [Grifola frondosa]
MSKCTWTEEAIQEWTQRRDAFRKKKGLTAMADLRIAVDAKSHAQYEQTLVLEREKLVDRLDSFCTETVAWPIEKYPVERYPAPCSGALCLPLTFRQTGGATKVRFREGEDLNRITYDFYNEIVDATYPGVNFVATDGFRRRRHEYMGPSPHIVDYQFHLKLGEAYIEWWDRSLRLTWMNDGSWKNEVYFDDRAFGWVSKLRGDFSRNLDLTVYLGEELFMLTHKILWSSSMPALNLLLKPLKRQELQGDYLVLLDLETLKKAGHEEPSSFSGLIVRRKGDGKTMFLEPVDFTGSPRLSSLLGELVRFDDKECSVYPNSDDADKPAPRLGLNFETRIDFLGAGQGDAGRCDIYSPKQNTRFLAPIVNMVSQNCRKQR